MDISHSPPTPRRPRTPNGGSRSSPKLGDFSQLKQSCVTLLSFALDTQRNNIDPPSAVSDRSARRAVKLLDLDHPVFARLQLSSRPARAHNPPQSTLRSTNPPSPSPVPVTGEPIAASRQEPIQQQRLDPYISATDEDVPHEDSDEFNDANSHTSTPATSPATSVNHNVDEKTSALPTILLASPLKKDSVLLQSEQPNRFDVRVPVLPPPSNRKAFLQQLRHGPHSWSQLQRLDRLRVADVVAAACEPGTADTVNLPWDMDGNFLKPRPADPRDTVTSRDSIEPLYRASHKTKLQILRAAMKDTYDEDARFRAHPWSQAVTNEPVHVYVDLSNIIIGFYNHLKARRHMPSDSRTRAPPFSFHAFATAVERGRPCTKRAIAGSVRAGSGVPAYMLEAEGLGYEMNILQRVRGTKKSVQSLSVDSMMSALVNLRNPYAPPPYLNNLSDSEDGFSQQRAGWREQAVDEVLHLKMMQSLLDTEKPATIVLCTGDAAEAEFSDGFLRNVERALSRGWYVEVVGWRDTMADAWFDKAFRKKHGWRFRTVVLDGLVEELLAVYG